MTASAAAPSPPEQLACSESIQDYAKAIYALQARGVGAVTTNRLADRLGVTPGSASAMVKRLAELGLVAHVPYHGARLTEAGEHVALRVLRRHRLLETYLAHALGMPWDRVHAEADVLEHHISQELEALIAATLGDPEHDPHGDPIPDEDLRLPPGEQTLSLADLQLGDAASVVRVSDRDPGMLRYLFERGLTPGAELEVEDRQPFGGPLFIRVSRERYAVGEALARAVRVRPAAVRG